MAQTGCLSLEASSSGGSARDGPRYSAQQSVSDHSKVPYSGHCLAENLL